MSDKIHLDIGSPGGRGVGADAGGARSQERGEADTGDAERFRASLAGQAPAQPQAAPLARPFDLFAGRVPDPPASSESSRRTAELVEQAVSRLLVGGTQGESEVRIRLKSDLLPGTEVRLAQRDGRLEVEFAVTDPESGAWLAAQSSAIAGEMARRLKRDVRVRVTDENEGASLADESGGAEPGLPAGPASLLARRDPEPDDEGRA